MYLHYILILTLTVSAPLEALGQGVGLQHKTDVKPRGRYGIGRYDCSVMQLSHHVGDASSDFKLPQLRRT